MRSRLAMICRVLIFAIVVLLLVQHINDEVRKHRHAEARSCILPPLPRVFVPSTVELRELAQQIGHYLVLFHHGLKLCFQPK